MSGGRRRWQQVELERRIMAALDRGELPCHKDVRRVRALHAGIVGELSSRRPVLNGDQSRLAAREERLAAQRRRADALGELLAAIDKAFAVLDDANRSAG